MTTNAATLFNGNIAAMAVNIPQLSATRVYNYHYDQLNRIVAMDMYNALNPNTGTFTPVSDTSYKERVSYDPNGNILGYLRNGNVGSTMDSLNYTYYANTNQLSQVRDKVSATKYTTDIDNQNANNYTYDATGNMVSAASDSISNITWNVYGKIATITKNAKQIKYTYDASGNRIMKQTPTDTTVYVRDATGNVMSVYYKPVNDTLVQSEMHLYGSSRLGMATHHLAPDTSVVLNGGFANGIKSIFTRGEKLFELSNHLGNVLATISDRRLQADTNSDGTVESYKADIISANDYYPFGMLMPKEIPDSTLISSGFDAGLDGWAVYNAGTLANDNGRLKFSGSQVWSSLKKDLQLKTGKQYRVRFTIDMGNCTELHFPIYKSDISSYVTLTGVGISIRSSGTYEGTFTATSNSMFLLFEMIPGVNPPPDSTGYYWIDDVTVEEIKEGDGGGSSASDAGYRYSINGQEKTPEIAPNTTTALYWEYDSRIGRRWNVDPKPSVGLSVYSTFSNNPILFSDALGDTLRWNDSKGRTLMDFDDGKKQIDIRFTSTRKSKDKNAKPGIYDLGIQWFEPLADNYKKPLYINPDIGSLDGIKHFSSDEIANFAMVDRDMSEFATGGSGDWKGSKEGANGNYLVTVNGKPYWADAIGQIPYAVNAYKHFKLSDGNTEINTHAIANTIKTGMDHGDGCIICMPWNGDYRNSYDNYMIARGAMWANEKYKVSPSNINFWGQTMYILKKTNYSSINLLNQVVQWQANRYILPFVKKH